MSLDLLFTPERIRSLRGNLSQRAFAEEVGVSQPAVAAWEKGKKRPTKTSALEALLRLEANGASGAGES